MKKYLVLLGVLYFDFCLTSVIKIEDVNQKFEKLTSGDMAKNYVDLSLDYLDIFQYNDLQHFKNFFQNQDLLCVDFGQIEFNNEAKNDIKKNIGQIFLLISGAQVYFTGLFCEVPNNDQCNYIGSDFLCAYVMNKIFIDNTKTRENFNKLKKNYGIINNVNFSYFDLKSLGLLFRNLYSNDFNEKNNNFIQYIFRSFNVDLKEIFSYELEAFKDFALKHQKKNGKELAEGVHDQKDAKYLQKLYYNGMHLCSTIRNIFMAQGLSFLRQDLATKKVKRGDSLHKAYYSFFTAAFHTMSKGLLSYSIHTLDKFSLDIDYFIKKVIFMNKDNFFNKIIGKETCLKMINDNRLTFKNIMALMFDIIYQDKANNCWRPKRNDLEEEIIKQFSIYEKKHKKIISDTTDLKIYNASNILLPSLIITFIEKAQNYIDSKKKDLEEAHKNNNKKKKNIRLKEKSNNNLLLLILFISKNNPYGRSLVFESDITTGKTLEECVNELKKYLPENEKGNLYSLILGKTCYLENLNFIKSAIHNQKFTKNDAIVFAEGKINNHESLNNIFFRTNEEVEKINKEENEKNTFEKNVEEKTLHDQLSNVFGNMDQKEESKDQKEELKEELKDIGDNEDNFKYYNSEEISQYFKNEHNKYDEKKKLQVENQNNEKIMNKNIIYDTNNSKKVILLENAVGIKDHLQEVVDILKGKLSIDKKIDISDETVFQMYFENALRIQSKPFYLSGKKSCFEATIDGKTRVFYTIENDILTIIGFHDKHRYNDRFKKALKKRTMLFGDTLADVMQQYNKEK